MNKYIAGAIGAGIIILAPMTAGANGKIKVCHYPPGNAANAHTIEISVNAWDAHQANHVREGGYDTEGECPQNTTTTTAATTTTVTVPETEPSSPETAPTTTASTGSTQPPSDSTQPTAPVSEPSTPRSTPTSEVVVTDGPTSTSPPFDSSTPGTVTSSDVPGTTTTKVVTGNTLPKTGASPLGEKIVAVGVVSLICGGIAIWITRKRPASQ